MCDGGGGAGGGSSSSEPPGRRLLLTPTGWEGSGAAADERSAEAPQRRKLTLNGSVENLVTSLMEKCLKANSVQFLIEASVTQLLSLITSTGTRRKVGLAEHDWTSCWRTRRNFERLQVGPSDVPGSHSELQERRKNERKKKEEEKVSFSLSVMRQNV